MDTGTVLVPYWVLQWHNRGRRGANKPTNTFKNKPTPLPVSSFDATYPPVPCLVRATGGRHHPAGSGETRRLPGAGPSRRAVPVAVEGPSALSTSPPPPVPLHFLSISLQSSNLGQSRPFRALPLLLPLASPLRAGGHPNFPVLAFLLFRPDRRRCVEAEREGRRKRKQETNGLEDVGISDGSGMARWALVLLPSTSRP